MAYGLANWGDMSGVKDDIQIAVRLMHFQLQTVLTPLHIAILCGSIKQFFYLRPSRNMHEHSGISREYAVNTYYREQ